MRVQSFLTFTPDEVGYARPHYEVVCLAVDLALGLWRHHMSRMCWDKGAIFFAGPAPSAHLAQSVDRAARSTSGNILIPHQSRQQTSTQFHTPLTLLEFENLVQIDDETR